MNEANNSDLLYVAAGSYKQAMDYCRGKIKGVDQMRYIDSHHKIRGLSGIKLHAYGTYYDNKLWRDIETECRIREIEIVYV